MTKQFRAHKPIPAAAPHSPPPKQSGEKGFLLTWSYSFIPALRKHVKRQYRSILFGRHITYSTIYAVTLLVSAWTRTSFGAADETDTFQPYVSESLIYEDNLFRLSDGIDAKSLTGKAERWDLNNRLSAGAKLYFPLGLQEFTFQGSMGDNRYVNNDQLDHISLSGKGIWKWQVGKSFTGTMNYGYRRYMGRFVNTRFFGKDLISDDTALFDINYRPNASWRLNAKYQWLDSQHSASERRFLDFTSNTGIMGIHYQSPAANSIGLQFRHTDARLPNRERRLSTLIDNRYKEYEFGAVYNWKITGKSVLDGHISYLIRSHEEFSQRDFEGEIWQVNYQWTPTGKTSIALSAWRNLLTGTQDLTASYIIANGFSISPTWSATSKISVQAKFSWEEQEYAGDPDLGAREKTRMDTVLNGQLSLSYDFTDHGQLNIGYRAGGRDSSRVLSDYEYNTVFANAILSF
ncbi:XrtB/PEP-CTERM-associated polysaccharide biosynthesis outer membrane protein EpsL [Methylocaldum marinum]|uniref:XrtB/PEP-CTERM-associated polysaccharide biosynthesis outer membrane protein EpsL n=1 Tax=Methylocaldum marinum TaxID=1432792 RepID=UPI000E699F89